jgi:hypothetical protein
MSNPDNVTDDAPEEGEILKANRLGPDQIHVGMDVMSIDGHPVGKVKEVRAEDFLLDRPLARDLYVPYSFVMAAEDYGGTFRRGPTEQTEVVLSVSEEHLDKHGWPHP